jgi:hypothetical protein
MHHKKSRARAAAALALGALLLLGATAAGAQIAAPDDWRKESFTFPLPYAPTLPYEGAEHVRFTPDWKKFDQPDGFSYVFLWDIRPTLLEDEALERAMAVYFDGLMNNVAIARKLEAMVPRTVVVLHPLGAPGGWRIAYAGTIHTWNGFAKAEPLVLNAEITQRPCGPERIQIFFAMSMADRAAPIWKQLRAAREATACDTEAPKEAAPSPAPAPPAPSAPDKAASDKIAPGKIAPGKPAPDKPAPG